MGDSTVKRAAQLLKLSKPEPEQPYEERLQEAVRKAFKDGPSVSVNPNAPGPPLPAGVPALPQLQLASAEVVAAKAKVAELEEKTASFEGRLAEAIEVGDADAVLAVRREAEEAAVRLWAARRDSVAVELAHLEAESRRIGGFSEQYGRALDQVQVELREVHGRERQLNVALEFAHGAVLRIGTVTERLTKEQRRLAVGPPDPAGLVAAKRREGWS